jgi:malate dehydrogenase (oxaloacetate-decarboxylating)(NADP+)
METSNFKNDALHYHQTGKPGKLTVEASKPCETSHDLSLAYTPGVAFPCMEIKENASDAYKYTAKANLVAVISDGTAVLGLGNIGALASKPVMEGKAVLFKRFADVDVFDIEINTSSTDEVVSVVKAMEPTFGGINLEDIKAPECFEIEERLIKEMDIPVFHDDQHGTAIITAAAFINALEISNKDINQVKIVFAGAGAASIACAKLLIDLGVTKKQIIMVDSRGVITTKRNDLNIYKEEFATDLEISTMEEAMKGADAFIGVSIEGIISKEMVKTMNDMPIIFAMANPTPEIYPSEVFEVKPNAIMATGRSDFPNQVNNVLGFPFIFRGALDVRAKKINKEMKLAAAKALSNLAKKEVTGEVRKAYDNEHFEFGPGYLIPKPFDSRVLTHVAPAVAKAAMDSGVARKEIKDFEQYKKDLQTRLTQVNTK